MAREYIVVCALPYSLARSEEFNVSLFFSPTIETSGLTKLEDWELFPNWGDRARGLRVELSDQRGLVESEPKLSPIDPALWRAMFPGDLAVQSSEVPDWSHRRWSSFSAKRSHDISLAIHMATILSDPANPPSPSAHPLGEALTALAQEFGCFSMKGRRGEGRIVYDESVATRRLDALVEGGRSLQTIERQIAGRPWLEQIMLELHRCRRYYERPEAQWPYRADPLENAEPPSFPENQPEFHSRCAALGDHPELLRRLGLVIDLVADRDRLQGSQWLSAAIFLDEDTLVSRPTRVRCRAAGDVFTTVPRTDDWSEGLLRVGDEERFSVLSLDTDGSALKADRFLWTLPRLLMIERNGDPVDAASPAQRSPGFTVSRASRAIGTQGEIARQRSIADDLANENTAELDTEDVARGVRVEVWDDGSGNWHSLHQRLSTAHVRGMAAAVYTDHPETGFIQGTTAQENFRHDDAPVQVHEAVFGWEGWSLSAPRPGRRIFEKNGETQLLDEQKTPSPTEPFSITTRVQSNSLPKLRYGRSYAFRAWAVDLAGNSRPHQLQASATSTGSGSGPNTGGIGVAARPDAIASQLMRSARSAASRAAERAGHPGASATAGSRISADEVDPEVVAHLKLRRGTRLADASLLEGSHRAARLSAAVSEALSASDLGSWSPAIHQRPELGAAAIGAHLGGLAPEASHGGASWAKAAATVTTPKPFLRWEPVPSPAIVPRWRYTEGESLRTLVIRSGVTQDPATLAITVEEPSDYVETASAVVPDCGYKATSERHLAPPKITPMQAEFHGMFDLGIGQKSDADRLKMLGWALRADGTFADRERADIDNPPAKILQPGMSIVHVGAPTTNLKALQPLADEDPLSPEQKVIEVGSPPAPGQTIIHDVDDLALPYLPDPMARGVALHFPQAGLSWGLPFPYAGEGFTVVYGGDWPELEPFRLVLEGGHALSSVVQGRVVRMSLPPGDVQLMRVSTSLPKDKLDLMGPWRHLPEEVRNNPEVAEASADGLLWGLSPFEQVTLIHAVNRPVEAPRVVRLIPSRLEGSTSATFLGAIDLHGPSTATLAAEASWIEPIDDPTLPVCFDRKGGAKAFETIIHASEDIALLGGTDQLVNLPDVGPVYIHRAVQEFSDTRHRTVEYTFRAFTRFREFFHTDLLKAADGNLTDEMHSVVGPVVKISVPSSARPAPPVIHSVLPLFRWSEEAEPEHPMGHRRTRRAGVRIYLERPWFSSGEGELLGVLIASGGDDRHYPDVEDGSGFPFVSKWGADPIWHAREVEKRALPLLRLDDLLRLTSLDDRVEPARPVLAPQHLPLASIPGKPVVTVLGYKPHYNEERELWYVDVAIDPGPQFWPFLRLAVCRYQPESIAGCHLSPPVQCDFVQIPPERTSSISRTDDRHVRVIVSGPVGVRGTNIRASRGRGIADLVRNNRRLVARLQQRDAEIKSDLGWTTLTVGELALRGVSPDGHNATWLVELDAGSVIPLAQPGDPDSDWRVAIEEWELIEADDLELTVAGRRRTLPQMERRLIYADNVPV